MTTKADTQSIRLQADVETAFEFIADPRNLPTWAVGFCRGIRHEGSEWIVVTAGGECSINIDADPRRRTVDFHMRPAPDVTASAFSRLLPCEDGCEYVFTQFSMPSMPDEAFQANVDALREELIVLRAVLHARHACPA